MNHSLKRSAGVINTCIQTCKLSILSSTRTPPRSFIVPNCQILNQHRSKKTRVKINPNILLDNDVTEMVTKMNFDSEMPKIDQVVGISKSQGWLTIDAYDVFAWSVSGTESCVVLKSEDFSVVFDMGIAIPESVKVNCVFITHGHIDHIGAVTSHVAKRGLFGMKPARYFVPPHLAEHLQNVMLSHYHMAETVTALEHVNIIPFAGDEVAKVNERYFVKSFPTIHRIPSQGYILYKQEKKLKEQYKGMAGYDVAALFRQGTDIHDVIITPEVAYTGDTTFDVFRNPPTPDLLKVKVLIMETTFIDNKNGDNQQKATDRGHTHLFELSDNADLFSDVGHIVLVHFSNKYSPEYINECLRSTLPNKLLQKVSPSTVAKSTTVNDFL